MIAKWVVAIFAHNEEHGIINCLDSLMANKGIEQAQVFVLANGCTDRTSELARSYSEKFPRVHIIDIKEGSKTNAWNLFVHQYAPQAEVYFFMDADVEADTEALSSLADGLAKFPSVYITSAIPASGRDMKRLRAICIKQHGVLGNLYCARNTFIDEIRRRKIYLPYRYVLEDGFVGALAKFNFMPDSAIWDNEKVQPIAEAKFFFKPMSILSFSDWIKYFKRLKQYGISQYQTELLKPLLTAKGLDAIPKDAQDLYLIPKLPRVKWNGITTLFGWFAIRMIRISLLDKIAKNKLKDQSGDR